MNEKTLISSHVNHINADQEARKQRVETASSDQLLSLFREKAESISKEFGDHVVVAYTESWNAIRHTPDLADIDQLKRRLLMVSFSLGKDGSLGISGIPGFDRKYRLFALSDIHPSFLKSQMNMPNNDIPTHSFADSIFRMRESVVRSLKNHEIGQKFGSAKSLQKFHINDKYEQDELLIPYTHPIGKLSSQDMKEFFPTVDEIRALEEWACYNIPFLVNLLHIKKLYNPSVSNPNVYYTHILLADKDTPDQPKTWKLSWSRSGDVKSEIKNINPKKPVLLRGFLKQPIEVNKPVLKTTLVTNKIAEYAQRILQAQKEGNHDLAERLEKSKQMLIEMLDRRQQAEKNPGQQTNKRWKKTLQ